VIASALVAAVSGPMNLLLVSRAVLCGCLLVAVSSVGASQWVEFGPNPISDGPHTGRVSAIAVTPSNPNRIFVAAASGGVWKTMDGGTSYSPLTESLPAAAIGALAIDPNNENVVYAGSGEANYANHSLYGLGLYKSTDGGMTWQVLAADAFAGRTIARILISPADGDLLYAAVGNAGGFPAKTAAKGHPLRDGPVGVFRSDDAGATWEPLLNGLPAVPTTDLAMDPADPEILYAAIGDIFGHADNGVYRTTNGGDNWTKLAGGFPLTGVGRISIAVAPSDSQRLYAVVTNPSAADGSNATLKNLYKSEDGGTTWTATNPGGGVQATYGWYLSAVVVHPTNPELFFFGGLTLLRSTDGGQAYVEVTPPHVDIHSLVFDSNDVLWCGDDGGVHRTLDFGDTWTAHNDGLGIVQFYPGVSVHPTESSYFIGGAQDNGTVRRDPAGLWIHSLGGDGGPTALHPSTPATVFAEIQGTGNIYRSINGGVNFVRVNTGIATTDRNAFFSPVAISPSDPARLLFATHRIYRSVNSGSSWTAISSDLTSGTPYAVRSMRIAPSDDQVVYAVTNDGRLQVSTDGGANWTLRLTGLPGWRRITREIVIDPTDDEIAYLAVSRFGADQVLRTEDRGATWTAIDGDLPDDPVNTVAVHRLGEVSTVFAGTDRGVYMTCDGGMHWRRMGSGLANSPVMDLVVDVGFHRLVAGTLGRGIWTLPLPGSGDADESGRTDMKDFRTFQSCVTGPAGDPGHVPPSADCAETFDLDFDGDVDLSDYICFGERMLGP